MSTAFRQPSAGCDRRTALRRGGAALAALATAGCLGGGSAAPTVEMVEGFVYAPETVTVAAGTAVTWENVSQVRHTVTADGDRIPDGAAYFASGGYDSERAARNDVGGGLIDPEGTYDHAFEEPGRYEYFCVPHEGSGMVGTVVVE
ncbi:MAG: plastocyanin/azurin family copper-binding protein [Haloferacaceae archaeon]